MFLNFKRRCRTLAGFFTFQLALAGAGVAQNLSIDFDIDPAATAGCAASVEAPAPRSTPMAHPMIVRPPSSGAYFGAYQIPAQIGETERFKEAIGQMPPIVFSFHDFFSDTNGTRRPDKRFIDRMEGAGPSLPTLEKASYLAERGSVLALAWAVYCCDYTAGSFWLRLKRPHDHVNRILRGEHDDFIRESARQIRDWGGPIMLTVMPEMNWQGQFLFGANGRRWLDAADSVCGEYGDPSWPDGPERVRDVHMRVVDLFREEGAHNVTWFMYSANLYMVEGAEGQSKWLHPRYYYPGDNYVDWVGQSVYFTDPAWDNGYEDEDTFQKVFLPGYNAWRSVTDKPMMLPEFGLVAEPENDRTALWTKTFNADLRSTPGVKAVTVADSELFAQYFDIPIISKSAKDTQTIRQLRNRDSYFRQTLQLGRGG